MIYICIPTYNEQQTVGVVLWKLRQVLTEFPRDYQLLVADDASADRTPEVLEPYTRVLPLTVIRSDRRLGQAASLEMLLREAVRRSEYPKRDIIVTLQADFSEEPDDVVPMIKRIEAGVDVVVGNKVTVSRPTKLRRMARALGSFFSRGQQWPEGLTTPFEGYRAYRLYAVKRALEDRPGQRVLRYDGWAGHAELLRAVLPHSRRIEVLDVEDRPDRLQRPRRERPFAAALQVRPMMRGVEPRGLVSVDELDRMAATASRSRDRTVATAYRSDGEPTPPVRMNGRARQRDAEAPRSREPRGEARGERRRDGEPARERSRPARGEEQRGRRSSAERAARPARAPAKTGQAAEQRARTAEAGPAKRKRRDGRDAGEEVQPAAEAAQETPVLEVAPGTGMAAAAEDVAGETRLKKRRRRRKRKSAGGAAAAVAPGSEAEADEGEDSDVESGAEEGERIEGEGGTSETGERKRRRRRGGRGRRRGSRPATAGTDSAETDSAETVAEPVEHASPAAAPTPPATPTEE